MMEINESEGKKGKTKEMRIITDTSGAMLNTPTFKS